LEVSLTSILLQTPGKKIGGVTGSLPKRRSVKKDQGDLTTTALARGIKGP